jgi:nitroreductase
MAMETIEALLNRRSIRKYKQEPIPDELVQTWIRCAMHAPSAGNEQPWHFITITNLETLKEITRFHKHAQMLPEASLAIMVCLDKKLEKHDSMAIQDCSAATQNILLSVHDQGYGAVWLGIYPRKERLEGLRQLLNVPEHVIPFSLIAIGKPAETKTPVDRFDSTRIHHETW